MYPAGFPDWKKIGKNVGKKLRHVLDPPSDHGPSRDDRRAQRLRDVLKGFAYFDDFDEVQAWSENAVDPVQRANTPLLKRSASLVHDQKVPSTPVLLCHDYNGGYHDYESVRSPPLKERLYSCHYLQYVDLFIYFSHKLVCIPPPTWTNTLHRNGVKVLGTFIVEPQTAEIERMLDQTDGEYIVAKQLAVMAHVFGFDGWLLNVEGEFPSSVTDLKDKMVAFITSLKRSLGSEGIVVWYDALTVDNEVDYQNSLSSSNAEFAKAADVFFTNYKWTEQSLESSRLTAQWYGIEMKKIFFGIDLWAQNTDMPGPPRITYPRRGGGGTLTGLALGVLEDKGFSAALFAPAWPYEHFPTATKSAVSLAEAVEESVWEGKALPDELECDCRKGKPHHREEYKANPIIRVAQEYPAGSSSFLESDFKSAFIQDDASCADRVHVRLGSVTVLPHLPCLGRSCDDDGSVVLRGKMTSTADQHLIVTVDVARERNSIDEPRRTTRKAPITRLCLFHVNMRANDSLAAVLCLRRDPAGKQIGAGIYTAFGRPDTSEVTYAHTEMPFDGGSDTDTSAVTVGLHCPQPYTHLLEIGVFCDCDSDQGTSGSFTLLHLYRLVIREMEIATPEWTIENVGVAERIAGESVERRLKWSWAGRDHGLTGLPWSGTTGPFAHFEVTVDGTQLGVAHCLEFPLRRDDLDETRGREDVEVLVRGVLFGGGIVSSPAVRLRKEDVMVSDMHCTFG